MDVAEEVNPRKLPTQSARDEPRKASVRADADFLIDYFEERVMAFEFERSEFCLGFGFWDLPVPDQRNE